MIKHVLYPLSVNEGFDSTQHEPLLLWQHVHILNAVLQLLSWPEEERTLTLWEIGWKESMQVTFEIYIAKLLYIEFATCFQLEI